MQKQNRDVEEEVIDQKALKYYATEEDEMEDRVDTVEREMKEMLAYLDDVTAMMQGDDLKQISDMIQISKTAMGEHVKVIDNIKENVNSMNQEAIDSVIEIAEVDKDAANWLVANKSSLEKQK